MGLLMLIARSPRRLRTAYTLFRSPSVPLRLKLIAAVTALAILSPLNILGDIPMLGLFDDAALLALLLSWYLRAASPYGEEISRQTLMVSRSSIAR